MAQIAWSTILFLAHALAKIAAEDESMAAAEVGSTNAAVAVAATMSDQKIFLLT
jgi:hypothetical protein